MRKQVGRYQWRGPPPSPCQVLLYPSGIVTPKYKAELLIPMPKNRMRKIKKTEKQNAQRKKYAKKQDTEREDKPWHPLGKREGFPRGPSGKEPVCQRRRPKSCRFDPWVWKIPWRSAWQHHSHTVDWEIPWPEEPGGLQSVGSQSHDRSDLACISCTQERGDMTRIQNVSEKKEYTEERRGLRWEWGITNILKI